MTSAWKQWEGQAVNRQFHLRQYLGGSDHSGVFLTDYNGREWQKAAIKLIPGDAQNAELQLSRWEQAAKLSHPHLLRILEMGQCTLENTPLLFVVMEYAEENLSQILPQRPLTAQEAGVMLKFVLGALAYLHSKGFVHGRIGPANIMATEDSIKLSSDAVCRVGEQVNGPRAQGIYEPPEASGGRVSTAGDVWALGVALVEGLTQRLPVWDRTAKGEPEIPRSIPAPFAEIARHCLRREAALRWSVAEIVEELLPAVAALGPTEPVVARAAAGQAAPHIQAPAESPSVPPTVQPVTAPARVPPPTQPAAESPRVPPPAQLATAPARVPPSPQPAAAPARVSPPPQSAAAQGLSGRPRYLVPAAIVALGLGAFFVVPRLFHRAAPVQAPSTEPAFSTAEPAPPSTSRKQAPAATERATRRANPERESSRRAEAPPPSAEPVAEKTETFAENRVEGEILQQVMPEVSQSARDTIRGTVRVSVKVFLDSTGAVKDAVLDSRGPSKYFAEQALKAARNWEFAPAKVNGESVASEWILRFFFTDTDTKVVPSEIAP